MSNKTFIPSKVKEYTEEELKDFAADLREQEAQDLKNKQESFDRSDTDGFLSQWASGINADLRHRQAEILDNGAKAVFCGLYVKATGRRVLAKLIRFKCKFSFQWKSQWLLDGSETSFGKRYIPSGGNSRIQKQLGLEEREEEQYAWAKLDGHGTGLSGTCYVATFRLGDEWGRDARPVSEEVAA